MAIFQTFPRLDRKGQAILSASLFNQYSRPTINHMKSMRTASNFLNAKSSFALALYLGCSAFAYADVVLISNTTTTGIVEFSNLAAVATGNFTSTGLGDIHTYSFYQEERFLGNSTSNLQEFRTTVVSGVARTEQRVQIVSESYVRDSWGYVAEVSFNLGYHPGNYTGTLSFSGSVAAVGLGRFLPTVYGSEATARIISSGYYDRALYRQLALRPAIFSDVIFGDNESQSTGEHRTVSADADRAYFNSRTDTASKLTSDAQAFVLTLNGDRVNLLHATFSIFSNGNAYRDYVSETNYGWTEVSSAVVSTVPEPETYALMLAGLLAVGFVAKRRHA